MTPDPKESASQDSNLTPPPDGEHRNEEGKGGKEEGGKRTKTSSPPSVVLFLAPPNLHPVLTRCIEAQPNLRGRRFSRDWKREKQAISTRPSPPASRSSVCFSSLVLFVRSREWSKELWKQPLSLKHASREEGLEREDPRWSSSRRLHPNATRPKQPLPSPAYSRHIELEDR